jgi:glutamate-1-semialdehyde 2,1-aminomutase
MLHIGFTSLETVKDYRDTLTYDKAKLSKFIAAMHNRGIRIIGRGLWYISAAHTKDEIQLAITTAKEVLTSL